MAEKAVDSVISYVVHSTGKMTNYEALQKVRSLRAQLKSVATKILTTGSTEGHREKREADAITTTAAELEAKAAAIEGDEGGYGARYLSMPEGRSLARLNSGLNTLVSALDTAVQAALREPAGG